MKIHVAAVHWLEMQQPPDLYYLGPFEFYPTQALTWFVELSSCFQLHVFVFFHYHLVICVWVLQKIELNTVETLIFCFLGDYVY